MNSTFNNKDTIFPCNFPIKIIVAKDHAQEIKTYIKNLFLKKNLALKYHCIKTCIDDNACYAYSVIFPAQTRADLRGLYNELQACKKILLFF